MPSPNDPLQLGAEDDGAEFHPSVFPIAGVPKRRAVPWPMFGGAGLVALVITTAAFMGAEKESSPPSTMPASAASAPEPVAHDDGASMPRLLEPARQGAFDGLSGVYAHVRAPADDDGADDPELGAQAPRGKMSPSRAQQNPRGRDAQPQQTTKKARAGTDHGKSLPTATPQPAPGLGKREIGAVVRAGRTAVSRRCWQPALAQRAFDAPPLVKVTLLLRVNPAGAVESVRAASDAHGYPGLPSCLESAVRAWTFPASDGPTDVRVPFVFSDR